MQSNAVVACFEADAAVLEGPGVRYEMLCPSFGEQSPISGQVAKERRSVNVLKTSLFGMLCIGFLGCAADDSDGGSGANQLSVATFNVGMARGYVDHAAERLEPIIEAIRSLEETDVLCVQEIWNDEDIDALKAGVSETFPESFMHRTRLSDFSDGESNGPACTAAETEPLVACAVPLCDGEADLASCVLSNCGDEFNAASAQCQECAAGNLGLGNVPDIVAACTSGDAAEYVYDGHNGLLLLSKTPILNTSTTNLASFLTVRSILYGEVSGLGIACTHLTATLSDPVYNGDYESYGDENAAQVDALIEFTEAAAGNRPAVIAGDFNNGPEVGSEIMAALPENFARFEAAGWSDVSIDSGEALCTWCSDNGLLSEGTRNRMLDHIVVKGATSSDYVRLFDERLDIEGADGETLNVSLSDHYGLRARIQW